jgi:AcrR family transcriptional regulator
MKGHRPPYHHGNLRNALVDRAVTLVETAGAEEFSLREAARLVGVSANAAYRHFSAKSALLEAVAEVGFERMERRLRTAVGAVADGPTRSAGAVERAKALGRAYVDFAVDHPRLLRLMFGARGLASPEDGAAPRPAAYALLGAALDELAAEGVLPADRRPGAELKAWTVVHGFASLVVQGVGAVQDPARRSAALEAVLDFLLVGLCGRLPSAEPRRARGRARRPARGVRAR